MSFCTITSRISVTIIFLNLALSKVDDTKLWEAKKNKEIKDIIIVFIDIVINKSHFVWDILKGST